MCGHRHHHRRARHAETARIQADDKRASDAEREQVATELRTHAGEGRLTVDELDQRIEAALGATTRRDLAALTADLPHARPAAARRRDQRAEFREHLRSYLAVMALLVAIWLLTGAGYFWPVWPALGWGIGILSHASAAYGAAPFSGPRAGGRARA